MIHVRLYSTLRKYYREEPGKGPLQIRYLPGMHIKELMNILGIHEEREVAIISVNGKIKGQDYHYSIQDGDRIDLYGFISGG